MRGKRMWGVAVIVTLAMTGVTQEVSAQTAGADVRIRRAEVLSEYALQVAQQKQDFQEAASLLREAAELRGSDQEGVKALVQAGHFSYYAGLGLQAVSALRNAAEWALSAGDGRTAVEAYLDAAWVAQQEGEIPTALELLQRGEGLARTGQLGDAELDDVLARIDAFGF